MSERERLYQLLDGIPDTKISYVIGYVQGLTADNYNISILKNVIDTLAIPENLPAKNRVHSLIGN